MLRMLPVLLIATVSVAACSEALRATDESAPATTDPTPTRTSASADIPPRADVPAPWLGWAYLPWEPGRTFAAPDRSCMPDDHPPEDPVPSDCPFISIAFDPSVPPGSPANPCRPGGKTDPVDAEMERRARIHNGVDCVNGWQYEWTGLYATPIPEREDPSIRDDGVISFIIVDGVQDDPGASPSNASGQRTCIADAQVLVKDGRVHEVQSKGRLVEIVAGEPVSGAEDLPDYDEIYLTHAVHREASGELVSGYRECRWNPRCFLDAWVAVVDGAVLQIFSAGPGSDATVGEPVTGATKSSRFNPQPVHRAADGTLAIGTRHCDPQRATPGEIETTGPVDFDEPRP